LLEAVLDHAGDSQTSGLGQDFRKFLFGEIGGAIGGGTAFAGGMQDLADQEGLELAAGIADFCGSVA
jgi:hypothetical protein